MYNEDLISLRNWFFKNLEVLERTNIERLFDWTSGDVNAVDVICEDCGFEEELAALGLPKPTYMFSMSDTPCAEDWDNMTPAEQDDWNQKAKKPNETGYDVWHDDAVDRFSVILRNSMSGLYDYISEYMQDD